MRQKIAVNLVLVDQGSTEKGTKEFLKSIISENVLVITNTNNESIHKIWNEFYLKSNTEFICFLNNDVRIPNNFALDVIKIFELEKCVGCVIHPTNNENYLIPTSLKYDILKEKVRQGWDFCLRREAYVEVPLSLRFFCGDDFIFENLFSKWKIACALSSPIIHYQGITKRTEVNNDISTYMALGYKRHLHFPKKYSKLKPSKYFLDNWNKINMIKLI